MYFLIRKVRMKYRYHPYKKVMIKKSKSSKIKIKTTPLPFQKMCLFWIKLQRNEKKNCVISLKRGFGKTFVSLMNAHQNKWNVLFISVDGAPFDHIIQEIKKHFSLNVKINLNYNSESSKIYSFYDITIINYYNFTRLKSESSLFKHVFTTCIVDELHLLTDKKILLHNLTFVKSLYFIGLDGTPCERLIQKLPHFKLASCYKDDLIQLSQQAPQIETIILHLNPESLAKYNTQIINQQNIIKDSLLLLQGRKLLSQEKIPFVVDMANKIPRQYKVVIFSEFPQSLLLLTMKLPLHSFMKIDSSVKTTDRLKKIKLFEMDDKITFLLCSRSACGVGVDLGFVDIMYILEPTYHLSTEIQMDDRITRLGQEPKNLKVQVIYKFYFENTCEEIVAESKKIIDLNQFLS